MNYLKTIQRFLGLTPDGVFGMTTFETLEEKLLHPEYQVPDDKLPPTEPPKPEIPGPTLKNPYHIHGGILFKGESEVSWIGSPNIGGEIEPTLVVVHYTGDNGTGGLHWLCDPASNVSAHLWISKSGVVWQLVNFDRKAWHAGVSSWEGHQVGNSVNAFSIGIENQGTGDEWPDAQIQANIDVIKALQDAYNIQAVVGHEDVAPGRKSDPGSRYPWDKVYESLRKNGFNYE